ncbi:apolipoprotein N-acyltransferase [Deinococcus multiflagellatus]|uniref:Apolipoprotein N-acyltransferase n=1 Tax=Deinococcus multiflagellatus TaxID=1656887 RepID=A0ABW1ZQ90_9DEIO
MPNPVTGLLLGLLLAACGLPLPWSAAAFLPLALILLFIASAPRPRQAFGRGFWVGLGYFGLHLWWLGAFLLNLVPDFPPLAAASLLLFALEGAFLASAAFVAFRITRSHTGRIWTMAGAWVLLEWLRFLGPLAFPWPTLGYTLLPTLAIQIADLGGVLLCSVLVSLTAASFAHAWIEIQQNGKHPLCPILLTAVAWVAALGYGLTRSPGNGPEQPMRVMRVTFDAFGRANGSVPVEQQFQVAWEASQNRPPGSVVVWSETALSYPGRPGPRPDFPGPGISGAGRYTLYLSPTATADDLQDYNTALSFDATGQITSRNDKTKLVPFGEEFPFQAIFGPVYRLILTPLGFVAPNLIPNPRPIPLILNGVQYGAYICYDSVFPRVARALAAQGLRFS